MKNIIRMCMRVFVTGVTAQGGDCEVQYYEMVGTCDESESG